MFAYFLVCTPSLRNGTVHSLRHVFVMCEARWRSVEFQEVDSATCKQLSRPFTRHHPRKRIVRDGGFTANPGVAATTPFTNFATFMAGLQADVYVSIGITWFAALVALCMRIVARQMTRIKWWLDDYLSVLAFVSP